MAMKSILFVVSLLVIQWSAVIAGAQEIPGLKTDIEFAKVGDVSLTLDAFVPEGEGPFPTCILVHGGGFINGDKQSYIKPLFEPLAKAKFAWFTINYRLAPKHRWPACADDVETAIRWVKENAKSYKVDVKRIALIGESAGGHLVSYAGLHAKADTEVAAVVPFYAPHSLEMQVKHRMKLGESLEALFDMKELNDQSLKILNAASPSKMIHPKAPPYLLIHGDADAAVPYEQSVEFQKQMQAAGNTCDLIKIDGGAHGMGSWHKMNSPYREQLVEWLQKTLK